jgi:hypothetical protein
MGQEVLQFINAGFNPLSQIAKDTGKSMADLKKEMEDGKISVQMVKQAFINATSAGGLFYKAIDRGSAGTTAKINQTKAAVMQLQVAFGTGFNEGLKDALDATNNFLPQLESKFTEAGEIIGSAITQAISGNTAELAAVGAFMGEIVFAGFKAVYLKGMDELVAGAQNTATVDPTGFKRFSNILLQKAGQSPKYDLSPNVESASLASYMQTELEQLAQSPNLAMLQGSRTDRQSSEIARKLGQGFNQNLTTPMMGMFGNQTQDYSARNPFMEPDTITNAVTDGVLKAFVKQAPGAKFTN